MPYQGPDIQLTATQGHATFKHVDAKCKADRPSLIQLSQLPIYEDLAAQAASIEQALETARQQHRHQQPLAGDDALDQLLESDEAQAVKEANAAAESAMEGFTDFPEPKKKTNGKRKAAAKAAAGAVQGPVPPEADAASFVSSTGRKASKKDFAQQEALESMDGEMKRVALAHLGTGKGTGFKCLANLQIAFFFDSEKMKDKAQSHCISSVPWLHYVLARAMATA